MHNRILKLMMCGFGTALAGLTLSPANAIDLYATSLEGNQLVKVNTNTQVTTPVFSTLSGSDSLLFDTSGRIIYSLLNVGQVRRFDPVNNTDTLLSSGLNSPIDLALEPSGSSVLVSNFNNGTINRIDLNTNTTTTLLTGGVNPEGLAYDSSGRLFANLGNRGGGGAGKYVAQIDPVTGAILATSSGLDSLDGLTFDAVTGHLFASSLFGNGLYEIDPSNLSSVTPHFFGQIPNPDGLTSDANGNIWVAARGNFRIYQYNIGGNVLTQNAFVDGLDDLAPASGLGAPVPEPGVMAIMGAGMMGLLTFTKRRR